MICLSSSLVTHLPQKIHNIQSNKPIKNAPEGGFRVTIFLTLYLYTELLHMVFDPHFIQYEIKDSSHKYYIYYTIDGTLV